MKAYGEKVQWGTAKRAKGEKRERKAARAKARQAGKKATRREDD